MLGLSPSTEARLRKPEQARSCCSSKATHLPGFRPSGTHRAPSKAPWTCPGTYPSAVALPLHPLRAHLSFQSLVCAVGVKERSLKQRVAWGVFMHPPACLPCLQHPGHTSSNRGRDLALATGSAAAHPSLGEGLECAYEKLRLSFVLLNLL